MHKASTGVCVWISCENSRVKLWNQGRSLYEESYDFIHIGSMVAFFRVDLRSIKVLPETHKLLELGPQEVLCRFPWPVIHLRALSSLFWPVPNKGTNFKTVILAINSSDLRKSQTELVECRREPRKLFGNGYFPFLSQRRHLACQCRSPHFLHKDIRTTDGILGV